MIRQLTSLGLKDAKELAETAGAKVMETVAQRDAASDNDPLDVFQPAGLESIIGADDVAVQHTLPRLGTGVCCQVRDDVHAPHGFSQAL